MESDCPPATSQQTQDLAGKAIYECMRLFESLGLTILHNHYDCVSRENLCIVNINLTLRNENKIVIVDLSYAPAEMSMEERKEALRKSIEKLGEPDGN